MEKADSTQHHAENKNVVLFHVLNWALMILMTAAAFLAVGMNLLPTGALIAFIVALAFVQAFLQVYIFMHLKHEKGMTALFIFWGAALGVIFALGVWWMV